MCQCLPSGLRLRLKASGLRGFRVERVRVYSGLFLNMVQFHQVFGV